MRKYVVWQIDLLSRSREFNERAGFVLHRKIDTHRGLQCVTHGLSRPVKYASVKITWRILDIIERREKKRYNACCAEEKFGQALVPRGKMIF